MSASSFQSQQAQPSVEEWLATLYDRAKHELDTELKQRSELAASVLASAPLKDYIALVNRHRNIGNDHLTHDPDVPLAAINEGIKMVARKLQGGASNPNVSDEEWVQPQPLPDGLPQVPAFDEFLLPDSLRSWIVDIAERAQAPLDYPAAGAITSLGSVIGQRLGIHPKRHDDWLVVPNVWGLIVGSPGLLKSPMLHEALRPLSRLEAQAREANQQARAAYDIQEVARQAERRKLCAQASRPKSDLNREGLVSALRELQAGPPAERRYIVNDSTVEKLGEILNQNPCGVLLFRDEIAGFLASMERAGHENDRAFYLEAWSGTGGYTYDRIARGTLHIEAACISVLGYTKVRRYLSSHAADNHGRRPRSRLGSRRCYPSAGAQGADQRHGDAGKNCSH